MGEGGENVSPTEVQLCNHNAKISRVGAQQCWEKGKDTQPGEEGSDPTAEKGTWAHCVQKPRIGNPWLCLCSYLQRSLTDEMRPTEMRDPPSGLVSDRIERMGGGNELSPTCLPLPDGMHGNDQSPHASAIMSSSPW